MWLSLCHVSVNPAHPHMLEFVGQPEINASVGPVAVQRGKPRRFYKICIVTHRYSDTKPNFICLYACVCLIERLRREREIAG